MLDGEEIPYEHLPLAFECLSSRKVIYNKTKAGGSRRISYSIDLGKERFAYHKYDNGDFEFTFRNLLHCALGAAKRYGSTVEFYKNGALHNEAGPAIIEPLGKRYFLEGQEVSLTDFIERSPKSSHSWGVRGDSSFTTAKLDNLAVVRGVDGTIALLSASQGETNVDDLLLDLVGTRLPGYKVFAYENIGHAIAPLYSYLQLDRGTWKVNAYPEATKAIYERPDGSKAILSYSKNTHCLAFKIKVPGGQTYSAVTDFGFDTSKHHTSALSRFPSVEIHRDETGNLHNVLGPAVKLPATTPHASTYEAYFLHGLQVNRAEHTRYDTDSKSITFINSAGLYHRHDGPAIIDFLPHGETLKYWFENGSMVIGPSSSEIDAGQLINLAGTAMPTYTDLKVKQEQRQNKFEEALKRVAKRSAEVKEGINLRGAAMDTKTTKHGEAPATTSDSRMKQVTSGAKLGLQKAVLRVGSQKVAEKIVEAASPTDNVVVQRIVQLALLLGTAELAERLPDGAASKVGFTEERREGYGGLARYVAGETLGRDAVDIVSFVAPMLLDKLQGISAEEIAELTADAEEVERLEAQVTSNSK
jgi:hypothetical protein